MIAQSVRNYSKFHTFAKILENAISIKFIGTIR